VTRPFVLAVKPLVIIASWFQMLLQEVIITLHGFETQVRLLIGCASVLCKQQSNLFVLIRIATVVFTYGEPLEAPLETYSRRIYRKTEKYWQNGSRVPIYLIFTRMN
jgi:hypothetical protein